MNGSIPPPRWQRWGTGFLTVYLAAALIAVVWITLADAQGQIAGGVVRVVLPAILVAQSLPDFGPVWNLLAAVGLIFLTGVFYFTLGALLGSLYSRLVTDTGRGQN